jgi:hypothetical protein
MALTGVRISWLIDGQEPALGRAGGHRVGPRALGRDGGSLEQRVGGAPRGEVARDLREAQEGARRRPRAP